MLLSGVLGRQLVCESTDHHIHMDFGEPMQVLSSAVLNGGSVQARHFVNWRVTHDPRLNYSDPATSLQSYCDDLNLSGGTIGMMTAAYMASGRMRQVFVEGEELFALTTTGLGNARRIGDPADERPTSVGTINLVVVTTAELSPSAEVEALMMMTEAKAAALQNLSIRSPVSDKIATGTGTDALAIVSARKGTRSSVQQYVGKHLSFGEALGRCVLDTIEQSLQYKAEVDS